MKATLTRKKDGSLVQKIIVTQDDFGASEPREMPEVGNRYFVWSRHYVGPNRRKDASYYLRWSDDSRMIEGGMVGNNRDPEIRRFHGWRGTSDEVCVMAESVRTCLEVERIEYAKTVHYLFAFGPDECQERE